jgi:hypothetical protein
MTMSDKPKREPTGDYETGYCRPPKNTRFKPGQSGNPTGRRKGTNNFATDVKKSLKTPVEIMRDGKPRKISTQEAGLMRLREKALKGDSRSLDRLIELAQRYNNEPLGDEVNTTVNDADLIRVFAQRMQTGAFSPGHETADQSSIEEKDPDDE